MATLKSEPAGRSPNFGERGARFNRRPTPCLVMKPAPVYGPGLPAFCLPVGCPRLRHLWRPICHTPSKHWPGGTRRNDAPAPNGFFVFSFFFSLSAIPRMAGLEPIRLEQNRNGLFLLFFFLFFAFFGARLRAPPSKWCRCNPVNPLAQRASSWALTARAAFSSAAPAEARRD